MEILMLIRAASVTITVDSISKELFMVIFSYLLQRKKKDGPPIPCNVKMYRLTLEVGHCLLIRPSH